MNIFKNSIAVTFLLFAAGVAQADLLGISPTAPSFFVFPARALPNASYDAASDTLSVAASVPGLRLADNSIIIIRGGTLQISVGIDGAGAAVLPGTSSDIVISGTVEINNITYSGVLLTGQLLSFGIADASQGNDTETDKIDFLFSKTGGQLSDFFGNFDIGVSGLDANGVGIGATLEASSYAGSFSSNWSASKFKADIGRIEPGCTGAIGDFVWQDTDGNGQQDGGEPGIGGVTVNITDFAGFNDFTVTAGDGSYSFTGLDCDVTYTVSVVNPDPNTYQPAPVDVGDDATDSDNHGGAPGTPTSAMPTDNTVDFGYVLIPASLGDFVWLDEDQDGLQGGNEPGLDDITVVLKDCQLNMITQTTTSNGGFYLFDDLDPGQYVVMVMKPDGSYSFTTMDVGGNANDGTDSDVNPATGNTDCITLDPGEDERDVDAGLFQGAGLGNYVWEDLNADGIQNDGNTGIEGVTVELLDCAMSSFNPPVTTTTDVNGLYQFNDLAAGCYIVMFSQPAGFDSASPTGQGGFETDSDADPLTGKTGEINLADGQFDPTWDAGFYKTASLGDRVWSDLNRNGLQDENEVGINDCVVELLDENMASFQPKVLDVTANDGNYLFDNLEPGTYFVQFSNSCTDSWVYTLQNVDDPASDAIDSDANSTGKTAEYTLVSGDENLTVDAGLHVPAMPRISIEKDTNGFDADVPTGPFVPVSPPGDLFWTYVVKNDGNVDLIDVVVSDDKLPANGQPEFLEGDTNNNQILETTETWIYTASDLAGAMLGQYMNTGSVCSTDATGATPGGPGNICDDDPSHYFGADPQIDIEKLTNGNQADLPDDPDVPVIPIGGDVTWTYIVTNTGNVDLTNIAVTDNMLLDSAITCPADALQASDPDSFFECTASGIAEAGLYGNIAMVTGKGPEGAGDPAPDMDPSHYIGETMPSIVLEKATNGVDADAPGTGPFIAAGGDVTWTYVVTNTGDVDLENVMITDDEQGAICTIPLLAANGGMDTCTKMGTAQAGDYDNLGTACGTDATGATPGGPGNICDDDPSRYFGSMPTIVLEKATNGVDADAPGTGPFIAAGGDVTWTYVVTNTGNVDLENVMITDDEQGAICTIPLLAANGGMDTCTKMGTAQAGDYDNLGTACGTDATGATPGGPGNICDDDPSRYFGSMPTIVLEKATNGVDADAPGTGPFIATGGEVTWTYVVTNTGNVDLENVMITDDEQGAICTIPLLAANGGMDTCTKMGTAQAGDYDNLGTACGTDATGATPGGPGNICDDDPSRYFGSMPDIDIEKFTNNSAGDPRQADNPTGPGLLVGSTATFTYVVTNAGNEPIKNVVVTDDRGVVPSFVGGDTNMDGLLDLDETWTYTGSATVVMGQYANIGTVNGTGNGSNTPVSDTDPSHHIGLRPGIDIEKATNGEDADSAPGVLIPVGETATFTYVVSNPVGFNEGVRNVVVVDDNGTADAGDNFYPAPVLDGGFNVGDLDGDNVLDFNETWTYTASRTVIAGQYTNNSTVTGFGNNTNEPVGDADPSNHFGLAPAIQIEKATNGQDADIPTGPKISVGGAVLWTYVVTNTGNEPLTVVSVTDNQGVVPVFQGGDTNNDGYLDLDEAWEYEVGGTAEAGQYANVGRVFGIGRTSNIEVDDTDPSHYFGLAQCDLTLEKMCFVVPPPVTNSAFACDKPIDSLTMIWNGPGTVWVEAWKGPVGSTSLGVQSVSNGGEITFTGFAGSPNDVFWEVYSDAGLTNKLGESKFHLSCSDDDMDGPEDCGKLEGNGKDNGGSLINQWLLEGIVDAKNTLDCTVDTDPVYLENCEFVSEPGASCETEGDVESLTFRYVPSDCSTTNTQEGRYSCTGGTLSGDAVFSLTANQDDYTVNPSNGQVSPNDLITISGKFSSNFEFRLSGNTVQDYEVHTSCSKALAVGDVFGSFELVGFNGKTGGQEVMYEYTVTNNSTGAVSNIDVTDNKIPGVIGTIASLPAGATSDPVYAQAFLTATTTNIGTATGDLVGTDDCAATSEAVTVTALEPPRSCETDDKPTSLTFDVTGSCSDQDNFQDGKAKCTGPDLTGDVVSIVINKDADKIGATVDDGDTITVFQTDKIGERLQSTVKFTITDSNGDSQYHEVHTSCSQPLAEGDLLGGIELVEYVPASN